MAQATNAFDTYEAIGNREDLTDMIYDISPTTTPFLTGVSHIRATATLHEWQTDALAAAARNDQLEGDEITPAASNATTRLTNNCQISYKDATVTGTQEAVNSAGRGSEMAYQMVKRGKELKRDMETVLLDNNAKVAGAAATARETAGVESWIATNTSAGVGGVDPAGTGADARTDGTQRAFTESQLKAVLKSCFDSGGEPTTLMVGSFNKQTASGFTGNSTRMDRGEDKRVVAAVDVYASDFGDIRIVPNRFQRARSALVLEMGKWAVGFMPGRNMKLKDLPAKGDFTLKMVLSEYCLEAKNEAASGIIADLTVS